MWEIPILMDLWGIIFHINVVCGEIDVVCGKTGRFCGGHRKKIKEVACQPTGDNLFY
jgi:hypothetical protein